MRIPARKTTPMRWRRMLPVALSGAIVLVTILAVMLTISTQTATRFRNIKAGWQEYSHTADPRGIWISEIRGFLGYGGMIHNFKNYVLRQDPIYEKALRVQTSYVLNAISSYLNANPDPLEEKALKDIRTTVEEYAAKIDQIKQDIVAGKNPKEVDSKVRVDDSAGIAALASLERHWIEQRQNKLNAIVTALSEGDALVRSLVWVMALLTVLVGLIAALIYRLVTSAFRSNEAELNELKARKLAEEEERKLAWVVQQSPASILITDTKGTIEFVNRKLLELTGYQEHELIGKTPNILKSGHTTRDDYAEIWQRLAQGHPWSGVFKNLRKDGSHYWAATSLIPLLDEQGQIINYIGMGVDITEKRRVDEQIAQVQKMEAVGILAGSVAHDFNNILMTIIGNTELIRLDAEEFDAPEDVSTSLEQIEIASRRARVLIQQLLSFARQQPRSAKRLELNAAINEALELIHVSSTAKAKIVFHSNADNVATDIDPTAFYQIIMNLCHNAIEAMGDKGGTVTITLDALAPDDPEGLAGLQDDSLGTLRILVCDNGPGIPKDIQERVFDPFFSTKPAGKGTGLGLAIVRNWITEVHGEVTLQSSRSKGTCFTLLFPRFEAITDRAPIATTPPSGHEHILLVDDEEDLLYTIRRMMARLGYRVEAFSNPALALHAFRTAPDSFDMVVSDLMMPEMGGDTLIERLREIRPELPALLLSSHQKNTPFPKGFTPVMHIKKPVDLMGLATALRQTLEN